MACSGRSRSGPTGTRGGADLKEGVTYKFTFIGRIPIGGGKTVKDFVVDEVLDDEDREPQASAVAADEALLSADPERV